MSKTAAMVQMKVVKAGGAGRPLTMKCSEILACFDPEITFDSHENNQGSLDKVEKYDPKKGEGYQAEHVPPAGTMHVKGRGLKGEDLVAGAKGSSYTTSGATTWMAHDGQTDGREHKILTDKMREFSQQNDLKKAGEKQATLKEWLKKYKDGAADGLKNADPKRKIKKRKPALDENSLIDKAAECIKLQAKEYFDKAGVGQDTKLRNPWPATKAQKAAHAVAQKAKKKAGF